MKPIVAAIACVLLPSLATLAHAEGSSSGPSDTAPERAGTDAPPRTEITGGAMVGGTSDAIDGGFFVEATHRMSDRYPLYLRGRLAAGGSGDLSWYDAPNNGSGTFGQGLVGVEGRECTRDEAMCLVGGVDAGLEVQRLSMTHVEPLAGGHAGLDFGGDIVRVRLVLDLYRGLDSGMNVDQPDSSAMSGGDLSLSVGYRF